MYICARKIVGDKISNWSDEVDCQQAKTILGKNWQLTK
jgi:hypothetical protein